MRTFPALFLALLVAVLPNLAPAACEERFRGLVSEHVQKLIERYPDLAAVLKDPAGFKIEMNERFLAAKAKDPKRPLAFDFTELGMPTIKAMREMIPAKLKDLEQMEAELAKNGARAFWTPPLINRPIPIPFRKKRGLKMAAEIKVGREYLEDLQKEIDEIITKGHVNYDQLIELSQYFSRAAGYFDRYRMSFRFKILALTEDKLQGYKDLTIQEEYQLYKDREFFLFQRLSSNKSTRVGARMLEESFARQDKLESIFVPSPLSLNLDVFYHLQPHFIYPLGISDVPVGADGVLRQSGLFYAHDMGHSGIMLSAMKPYFADMPAEKVAEVQKKMEEWYGEYLKSLNAVKDKQLRHAIRHLAFNLHHERGYPLAPSTYKVVDRPPLTSYLLFYLFDRSNQTPGMGRFSFLKIPEAWRWLEDFWKARAEQEAALLGNLDGVVKNYNDRMELDRVKYDQPKK